MKTARTIRAVLVAVILGATVIFGATVLGATVAGATVAPSAAFAADGESIRSYVVEITIKPDGRIVVEESIAYDFGDNQRHGIFRRIPTRKPYNNDQDRVYPLDGVSVTMDGVPAPVEPSSDEDGYETLRIGDPDRTVTGPHTYRVSYQMRGVLNGFADHVELYWDAIGAEWDVPIGASAVTVNAPKKVQRAECFAGPVGTTKPCAANAADGPAATFTHPALAPRSAFTVVVGLPPGSVSDVAPILVERHDFAAAFSVTPFTVVTGLLLALGGVAAALVAVWRTGRDHYYVGQLPGLVPEADEPAIQRRKPLFGAPPVSVEFTPPDKIRPGQVGTLVDERADVVDVTATIIDFAVRRHLRITEIHKPGRKAISDWRLTKLTDGDPAFLPYERRLFKALFASSGEVLLSELKDHFAAELSKVRDQLYKDMVTQGWYPRSPRVTRSWARGIAVLLLLGAVGLTGLLALTTHVALIGVGLLIAAVFLLIVAGRFPARTGKGSAALARVQGFRLYVATAEAEQLKFQEREKIFSEYLPYAIVFGLTARWAAIFNDLASERPDGLYWYRGQPDWSMPVFVGAMASFSSTSATTMASTPNTSSSGGSGFSGGFSGGGAGGGGGGSW